ncbi:MAG: CPBP family intramembrane glutamic endopeptidase [Chryseolinea sp.]
MQPACYRFNIFGLVGVMAFVVFSFAIGETVALQVTAWLYKLGYDDILETIRKPSSYAALIITFSVLSTLLRFIAVPFAYLAITDRGLIRFIFKGDRLQVLPVILCVISMACVVPLVSLLIGLNNKLIFSGWFSGLETYVNETVRQGKLTMSVILSFNTAANLILTVFVASIIPGIAEEIFFRGILQSQIQKSIPNHHVAIFISGFLFSLFHFQFDTFIPKLFQG